MSIADHFDHKPDVGFVRSYDLQAARRQLQVSLMLLAVMVVAALALVSIADFGGKPAGAQPSTARGLDLRVAQS